MPLSTRRCVAALGIVAVPGLSLALAGCPGELAPLPDGPGERDGGASHDSALDVFRRDAVSPDAADAGPPSPQVIASGQNAPVRIAVDGTSVYWTDYGTGGSDGFLVKASVHGLPQQRLVSYADPWGITLHGGYVYWTSYGSAANDGQVSRISTDGGPVETLASSQSYPWSIATDGVTVYWTQQIPQAGTISAGSVATPSLGQASNLYWPLSGAAGLALRDGILYFTNYDQFGALYALSASAPAGTMPTVLAGNQDHPFAVTTNTNNVYWSTQGAIMAVPLGGGASTRLADTGQVIVDIAVDSNYVYWTDYSANRIMEVPLAGGRPIQLASGQNGAYGIALDADYVYWTTYLDGTVMRMPKWP